MNVLRKSAIKAIDSYRFIRMYSQYLPQAFNALFSMPCAVTLFHGTLKRCDESVSVLYVGRRHNLDYLCRMIFDDCRLVDETVTNLLAFRPHMERVSNAADVIVMDLGWPYNNLYNRKRDYLEVPDWINMAIDLPAEWSEVIGNFRRTARKHDMRLIRRNGYRCEAVSTREAAENFYHDIYVPFVGHRHESESVVASKRHVIRRAMQGRLLHILRGDDITSAGIIYPEGEVMYSLWMGIPRKYLEDQPEAAISALYYFGIRYAFDQGYKVFDFTGTRAFLNDGAYQFKRRWGPITVDEFSPGSILIKPKHANRKAALFCQQVPVLTRTGDGLEAVFVRVDGEVDVDTFARLDKEYGCGGIVRATVIEISDKNETKSMPIGARECQYRWIKCPLQSFADIYVMIDGRPAGHS